MVCRLARRKRSDRKAPSQSIPHQNRSHKLPKPNAPRGSGEKPPHLAPYAIAQAWAAASPGPKENSRRWVARQLAQAFEGLTGHVPQTVVAGLAARWKAKYAASTMHSISCQARKILRDIDQTCGTSLTEGMPKPIKPRERIATPEELAALLAHAEPWLKLWLLLMATLGLRFSEALHVGAENYDRSAHTITITTKGEKRKTFPVTAEIETLFELAPEGAGTFIERLRGRHIKRDWMREHWWKLKKKAGVAQDLIPHDLRRTAAVRTYTATHDIWAVKALLGHEKLDTTAWYLKPYDKEAMNQIQRAIRTWTPTKGEPVQ